MIFAILPQLDYFSRKRTPLFNRSQQLGNLAFLSFVLTLIIVVFFGIYILIAGIGNDQAITNFEVILGAIAAVVAYFVGDILENLISG